MKTSTLILRSLTHYWRTNAAVVLGVGVAVAVLAGALLVGASVRASLRELALSRLGAADYVVTGQHFFREALADDLVAGGRLAAGACPLIATDGLVIHETSGRRSARVQVYGVDQRFWKFHGRAAGAPENWDGRGVLISEGLAAELQSSAGETLLLRVEKPQAIPSESLHGRRDEQGRTLRLSSRGTLPAGMMGDFSPRPQQGAVRAVFVPLGQLQRDLEQPGKANIILLSSSDKSASDEGNPAADGRAQVIAQALGETFALEDAGVKLRVLEAQLALSLESEAGLISDELAKGAQAATQTAKLGGFVSIFSYLANGIRAASGREVPYSIVTAVDENIFAGQLQQDEAGRALTSCASPIVAGTATAAPPILLNEWAANDLGVKPGDEVSLDYYVWLDEGRLATGTHKFRVECVVPMSGSLRADRDLTPEYPGLSESESMADWDPPFPVDLKRIRPQDEDYWKTYRTTPKAFIRLDTAQRLWPSRFGKLTSMRLFPAGGQPLAEARGAFAKSLRSELDPARAGFSIQAARSEALNAARGATDFGEYFLYFSFFLVASALLLAGLFFKLGIEQRLREIGLLRALGFPAAQVRHIFVGEGALLAVAGSLLGVALALGYGWLIMRGLRTWWVDAVGTRQLTLHAELVPLLAGGAGGVLAALIFIVWSLRALARRSARSLLAGVTEPRAEGSRQKAVGKNGGEDSGSVLAGASRARLAALPGSVIAAAVLSVLGVGLVVGVALGKVSQVGGFFGAGTLWLAALLCFQLAWLRRGAARRGRVLAGRGWWAMARLGFRGATSRPGRSVLCIALIAAATFIIVAVEAFRRDGQQEATVNRQTGTGGYALFAETLLPLTHNPETAEGREALNLTATNGGAEMLKDGDAFTRFRLRPGDDASCLNLYRPQNPRILGATDAFIHSQRFSFLNSMAETPAEKENPWLLLNKESGDQSAVPIIADANSLAYVLHLKVGDELTITDAGGRRVRLRVVAALADSLFQSELVMAERHFVRLFPQHEGYRFFLLDAGPGQSATVSEVAGHLEDRLSDYGFDAQSTAERLASFHRVENTYLSTFQLLGGLGMALGTLGLAAVLLRNVFERRRELALLRAVGYGRADFAVMILAENALLLGAGLLTGISCALLAIAPAYAARGGQLISLSLAVLLLAVLAAGLLASLLATWAALRAPLLPSLRTE